MIREQILILGLISLSILMISCSSAEPECITDFHNGTYIRWGEIYHNNDKVLYYQLDQFGILSYDSTNLSMKKNIDEKIKTVDFDEFCKIYKFTNKVTISTQALNARGDDISKFIMFEIPITNVSSRAIWNPDFENIGSKKHRLLYDSLMTLVPKQHKMYEILRKSSYLEEKNREK
jgi:hypothetical protein